MKHTLLLLTFIVTSSASQMLQRTQMQMGTLTSISLAKEHQNEINQGFKLIKQIELSLSSYNKNALLYQLNQHKKITADKHLLQCIQKSQAFHLKSNAYFNIAIGSVTKKLYDFGKNEKIPTKVALKNAHTSMNGIHINKYQIHLDQNTTLDLGGIGKGFAVDKVAHYYRNKNISKGIIALSGDIQALHPTEIYIDSPFKNGVIAKLTTLKPNTSISTSGTYRRYVKEQKYHHLINPKNKRQGQDFLSITLITQQDNTLIDAMATAIGVMPLQKALHFLVNNPHIGYILVRPNGNILHGNLQNLVRIEWL